ncbi:hypothetical protein K443DRAFT_14647 [Laccaria amethystina LaAM-08-1]|uniref:Uncharacterized protein n=1 Tax=Laccaria amethystina LaAM-08-1 TaxID=1095629 RepID=A0A0C9X0S4_9AGAR|nr:hypothetical protein K443DRAFT_14647 [Laccaria amethystina LaAM-08-1]
MLESSKWEEEIGASTATWWNNCVLLAMPVVSTSWYFLPLQSLLNLTLSLFYLPNRSMLLFLGCIVSLVWFKGSGNDPSTGAPMSATPALGPRVAITGLLVVGTFYFAMIVKTLTRYEKEREEMRADAEMSMGAVSVQNGEPEDRGREI